MGRDYDICEFNGVTSSSLGLIMQEFPTIPSAKEIVNTYQIAGRDGSMYEHTGIYEDIVFPVKFVYMCEEDKIREMHRKVEKLFSKPGVMKFSDDDEVWYKVKKVEFGDSEKKIFAVGAFTITVTCSGYKYIVGGDSPLNDYDKLYNPYCVSHPVYEISGTGVCSLTVNGNSMTANVETSLTIDTDRMISYRAGDIRANTSVKGKYDDLYLKEGDNTISITNGFSLSVIPNWRTR